MSEYSGEKLCTEIVQCFRICLFEGDVLSGTSSSGLHHAGVLEGWFGERWWTGRFFILLVTTLAIFSPLACFKRIGLWLRGTGFPFNEIDVDLQLIVLEKCDGGGWCFSATPTVMLIGGCI